MHYDKITKRLLSRIKKEGVKRPTRGVPTRSLLGITYTVDLTNEFPLLTLRELKWENIVIETLWFMLGRTDNAWLKERNLNFWTPWADALGEIPSAYGHWWRNFHGFDQLQHVISLLSSEPYSRRMVVSAWEPAHAAQASLPPCHVLWSLYGISETEFAITLTQRSCDVPIGLPYNTACYALLGHLIGYFTDKKCTKLLHNIIDAHIYENQLGAVYELLVREESQVSPTLVIDPSVPKNLNDFCTWAQTATRAEIVEKIKVVDYRPQALMQIPVMI